MTIDPNSHIMGYISRKYNNKVKKIPCLYMTFVSVNRQAGYITWE
jgi:hypothetical protein